MFFFLCWHAGVCHSTVTQWLVKSDLCHVRWERERSLGPGAVVESQGTDWRLELETGGSLRIKDTAFRVMGLSSAPKGQPFRFIFAFFGVRGMCCWLKWTYIHRVNWRMVVNDGCLELSWMLPAALNGWPAHCLWHETNIEPTHWLCNVLSDSLLLGGRVYFCSFFLKALFVLHMQILIAAV